MRLWAKCYLCHVRKSFDAMQVISMHYQRDLNSLLTVGMAVVILVFVVIATVRMRHRKRGQAGGSSGIGNAFLVVEAANSEVAHVLHAKKNNVQRRHRKKSVGSDKY